MLTRKTTHPQYPRWQQTILPSLSLFASVGTLLCCALPALLVTLGLGAALAGFIGAAPWITAISEYKTSLFIGAGTLLVLSAWVQWRSRYAPCPTDPIKARACKKLRQISWIILGVSILIYVVGFFFAFIAVHVFF